MKYATLLMLPTLAWAQIEAPRVGCFVEGERAFEIAGVAASFVVTPVEACAPTENSWSVVSDGVDAESPWLEKHNAEGAVEARRKLEPGSYAVWADGVLVAFAELALPGPVTEWRLASEAWMLLRVDGHWLLLNRERQWFYLPMPEVAA